MRISALLAALVLIGCKNGDGEVIDLDGDGYSSPDDCDDSNAAVSPAATEVCNDIDDNCDGQVDEGLRTTYYRDGDGDGFGDPNDSIEACSRPTGYVGATGDCDDSDATAFPGNIELCDDVDHNCDGSLTEGAAGNATFYADADGDGHGDPLVTLRACSAPAGYTASPTDCDDTSDTVNPDADETCNGVDDDCNGLVDDDATDAQLFSYDRDGDGFGIIGLTVQACGAGQQVDTDGNGTLDAVTVAPDLATDCNDANATIFPGADELCNGVDDDCDPDTDEDTYAIDTITWFGDADGDQAVDPAVVTTACVQPTGYGPSTNAIDCDDDNADVSPYASEFCNGIDDDCDGITDEGSAVDAATYYQDFDEDGFGNPLAATTPSCVPLDGFVDNDFDCDDSNAAIGAPPPQYLDADLDGYGDPDVIEIDCAPVSGYVDNDLDCDDSNSLLNPETLWYADADGDGYGDDLDTLASCEQPVGYALQAGDCDDDDDAIQPGAVDLCNGVDDDCDGDVDEDCVVEHCGVIAANEVWAGDQIHLITCDVRVQGTASPTLRIEDGADVRFAPGVGLFIGTNQPGTLQVDGGAAGVQMRSANLQSPQLWAGVTIGPRENAATPSTLSGLSVRDAGSTGFGVTVDGVSAVLSSVSIEGANGPGLRLLGAATLQATASEFRDNNGAGIQGSATSRITTFTGNELTGNLTEPLVVSLASVGVLDASSVFSPNGRDAIGVLGGTITADLTLEPLDAVYRADGDIVVAGPGAPRLTLLDGVEVRFQTNVRLTVGNQTNPGTLRVNGTTEGVTMRSANVLAPTRWGGISIGPRADAANVTRLERLTLLDAGSEGFGIRVDAVPAVLDGVVVDGASGNGVTLLGASTLQATNSQFVNNDGRGVQSVAASRITTFNGNTLSGNATEPLTIALPSVGSLNASSSFTGNGVDAVGILGGTLTANTAMAALDAPYRADGDILVQGAGTPVLTLADGVELQFSGTSQLRVGASQPGTLITQGASQGVLMRSSNLASPTAWGGVWIGPNANGANPSVLQGLTVLDAGSAGHGVRVEGVEARLVGARIERSRGPGVRLVGAATLQMATTTVRESEGVGVLGNAASRVTLFTANTLTANTAEPIVIDATSVRALDATSAFAGNTVPAVAVLGGTIDADTTLRALDTDFRVDGDITVRGASAPVLTVQDGVRVRFAAAAGLTIGDTAPGRLVVDGISTGVEFTGTAPTPGHWDGVRIGDLANSGTIRGLNLSYGGGNGRGNLWLSSAAASNPNDRSLYTLDGVTSRFSVNAGLFAERVKLAIVDSDFANNVGHGARILDVVFANSSVRGSEFSDNGLSGVQISPQLVELLDATPANAFNTNTFPIEIIAGTVATSASWRRLDEDYYVTGIVDVQAQAESVLTLEEGTTLYFAPAGRLRAGAALQGSLVVLGTPAEPVTFDAISVYQGLSTPRGSYAGLFLGPGQRSSRLDNLIVLNAGSTVEGGIFVTGTHPNPVEMDEVFVARSGSDGIRVSGSTVWIHDSSIEDNDDVGVRLVAGGRLQNLGAGTRSFTDNVVTANALHGVELLADNAGQLDPSSSFVGNNLITGLPDRVALTGNVTRSQSWAALGVEYWPLSEVRVGGPANPTLTLDPGVRVVFRAGTDDRLYVGPRGEAGGIYAVGTPAQPVVFTSDEDHAGGDPLRGDWGGIELGPDCIGSASLQGDCVLEHVHVDYAGSLQEEAAIMVATRRSIPAPTQAFIQRVRQRYSGSSGLQYQAEDNVINPTPTPALPAPTWTGNPPNPYPFACEDIDGDLVCDNFDLCWDAVAERHGSTNLFCDNGESNVSARNFSNPFIWVDCTEVGLDDGPLLCP